MSAIQAFTTFMASVGPTYLTGPEQVLNEATRNTYLLKRFLKGRQPEEVLQGGSKIKDVILFDAKSTATHYRPNQTFSWSNPQTGDEWEIFWRFTLDHMAWTDQEITLAVERGMTREAKTHIFKRIRRQKEQRMWTSLIEMMENSLTAVPATDMEDDEGVTPYSLWAFITEDTTNYHPSGWTTIQNIDPASKTGWRNAVETYSYADPANTAGTALFDAFDRMMMGIKFETPPTRQEYFENERYNRMMILCSKEGRALYMRLLRSANDRLMGNQQDPAYNNPAYAGIDVLYISALDSAALYSGGTGTETGATTAGRRYYFVNGNYIKPVWHSERYFSEQEPMRHPNQPFSWVQPVDCWWNLVCTSRRRQGIVAPAAS